MEQQHPQYQSRVKRTVIRSPERENPMQVEVTFSDDHSAFFARSATVGDIMLYCATKNVTVKGIER